MAENLVHGRRGPAHAAATDAEPQMRSAGRWVIAVAGITVACLVVGGYGMGWRWTALSRGVPLWDWLQALLLPVSLGLTPVLLLQRIGCGGGTPC